MKLFLLSKENLNLSVAEAERLHATRASKQVGEYLFLDADLKEGLAFTREVHEILFEPSLDALETLADAYPWEKHITPPFSVSVNARGIISERLFAGFIWRALESAGVEPEVSLNDPVSEVHLFSIADKIVVTKLLWRNQERFFDRRSHLRPRNHPTSLNPKLARAMVNLAGPTAVLLDPFCGAGGILIEGSLVGRTMTGVDIDNQQIARAEENLAYYDLTATLTVGNATKCDELGEFDAIVTDLPLGKNATLTDAARTFKEFFSVAAKITPISVVAIDASYDLPALFSPDWKERAHFDWYLHKGMKKRVFLLEH